MVGSPMAAPEAGRQPLFGATTFVEAWNTVSASVATWLLSGIMLAMVALALATADLALQPVLGRSPTFGARALAAALSVCMAAAYPTLCGGWFSLAAHQLRGQRPRLRHACLTPTQYARLIEFYVAFGLLRWVLGAGTGPPWRLPATLGTVFAAWALMLAPPFVVLSGLRPVAALRASCRAACSDPYRSMALVGASVALATLAAQSRWSYFLSQTTVLPFVAVVLTVAHNRATQTRTGSARPLQDGRPPGTCRPGTPPSAGSTPHKAEG